MSTVCGYCGNKIITLESLMDKDRYGNTNMLKPFNQDNPYIIQKMQLFKGPDCRICGVSTSNEGGTCTPCMKKEKEKGKQPMPTGPTPTNNVMCNKNCINCKCPKAEPFATIPETKPEFKLEDLSDFAKGELAKLKRDTENIIKSQTRTVDNMKANLEKAEENLKKEQNTLSFLDALLK